MTDETPTADRVAQLLDERSRADVVDRLAALETAPLDERKAAIQTLQQYATEQPQRVAPVVDILAPFLTDDERSIRLTTAKLFVAVAEADPDAVVPCIDALADRLADDDELYFVRARSAEALGYVALEHPETVASPALLADLRVGLSFDESAVKVKLAKALEFVALGNPERLRHQVSALAEHLDDESDLVRYHLTTALVVVGCECPEKLADASDALTARLADGRESPYIRGRAAEALGLLGRTDAAPVVELRSADDIEESFALERLRFARRALGDESNDFGTVESVRETTADAVDALTASDSRGECPQCGGTLPDDGPPMCPRCGAPY